MRFVKILSIFLLCCSAFIAQAQIDFYAGGTKEVALNGNYQVVFVLENASGSNFHPPQFEGFNVIAGPIQEIKKQNNNGHYFSSLTYRYVLRPLSEGAHTIASASINVNGNTLYTEKLEVMVLPPEEKYNPPNTNQSPAETQKSQDPNRWKETAKEKLFVKLYTNNETPYVGEQVFVYAKLYLGIKTYGTQLVDYPEINGFWNQEIEVSQDEPKVEEIDGEVFHTYIIAKHALFPLKEGTYTIDPVKLQSLLLINNPVVMTDFWGNPVEFMDYKQVVFDYSSNSLTIKPKALPLENRPINFIGAVGDFTLTAAVDSPIVELGRPIHLKATIKGTGNIMAIQEPQFDFPEFLEIYDPEIDERISSKSDYVNGSKTFDYIIVPTKPGNYTIPSIDFSFFDATKNEYVQLQSPEFAIQVNGELPEPEKEKENTDFVQAYELAPLHTESNFTTSLNSFYGSTNFYLSLLSPFVFYGFFLFVFRWKETHQIDLVALKNKRALKEAKKRLIKAKMLLDKQDKQGFYTEIFDAFNGYVSDKFAINQAELNKEFVQTKFEEKNITSELAQQFNQVLSNAEEALYSPASISKMQEDYDIAITWIVKIENEIS